MMRGQRWHGGRVMRAIKSLEGRVLRKGLVLSLAALVCGVAAPSAQSQTRTNIWLGDNSYNVCKRTVSADFTTCLRTRAINNPGARYASCNATWKENMAICWTSYKFELANRRSNLNWSNRGVSSGRVTSSSRRTVRRSSSTTRVATSKPSSAYKAKVSRSKHSYKSAAKSAGNTGKRRHKSGGLIRDPARTVRRDPGRGP